MPAKEYSLTLLPLDLYELTDADIERFAQEASLGMVSPQNPILTVVARAIRLKEIRSSEIQGAVQRLLVAAGSQQDNNKNEGLRRMLVGLAAPQIGESLRIIVVDTEVTPDRKKAGTLECFINPKIIWRSREKNEAREGCFSAGPVWGLVRRSSVVTIQAFTPDGQKVERTFEDFTARIVQHEIDHLQGIRFPDRIRTDKKRHWVHAEEIIFYPDNIQRWPRSCSLKRWQQLKSS